MQTWLKPFSQFSRILYWKSLRDRFFKAVTLVRNHSFILVPIQVVSCSNDCRFSGALTALGHHDSPLRKSSCRLECFLGDRLGCAGPVVTLTQGLLTDQLVAHINLALMGARQAQRHRNI